MRAFRGVELIEVLDDGAEQAQLLGISLAYELPNTYRAGDVLTFFNDNRFPAIHELCDKRVGTVLVIELRGETLQGLQIRKEVRCADLEICRGRLTMTNQNRISDKVKICSGLYSMSKNLG